MTESVQEINNQDVMQSEASGGMAEANKASSGMKWLTIGAVVSSMMALLAIAYAGFTWWEIRQGQEATTEAVVAVVDVESSSDLLQEVSKLEVEFIERELVWASEATGSDKLELYEVGEVKTGEMTGSRLWLLKSVIYRGPCKGSGCSLPHYSRFVKTESELVYLAANSSKSGWMDKIIRGEVVEMRFGDEEADEVIISKLNEYGRLRVDEETIVDGLERVERFEHDGLEFELVANDMAGIVDEEILIKAFEQEHLGELYMTRPDKAWQKFFYYMDSLYDTNGIFGDSVGACRDEECLVNNGFFWFRPDGTYLSYRYKLPFELSEVDWNEIWEPKSDYVHYTKTGCSGDKADYVSVVSPAQLSDDRLSVIGRVGIHELWGVASDDDAYMRAFYNQFVKEQPEWLYANEAKKIGYDGFVESLPMFFWKDPWGRLIRFTNTDFTPPLACEPIVYLYPEEETVVSVKIGNRVKLLEVEPEYKDGWRVLAKPNGRLKTLDDNKSYPYLFWEGRAGLLPRPEKGFVVAREEIKGFFNDILPKLGLNRQEKDDFMEAWLPKMQESLYYRIGFYEQEVIEAYAPLLVEPKPGTLIRVLFDYMPLDRKVELMEPELPMTPERDGFVVVEWGGLDR